MKTNKEVGDFGILSKVIFAAICALIITSAAAAQAAAHSFSNNFNGGSVRQTILGQSALGSSPETKNISVKNDSDTTRVPREVRVVTQNTTAGQTITVVLEADTMGDESIYGFSLNYNPAILTYVANSAMIGSGATAQAGGMCSLTPNTNTAGQFGFSINCNNSTITAGNSRPLLTLRFTVASNAPQGATPLQFGDTPARRSVSSNPNAGPIQSLATTFTDGTVTIAVPTASSAGIGGRVISGGRAIKGVSVSLFDTVSGEVFYTTTDAAGVYRFGDVPVGESYIVTPQAIGYTFNPTDKLVSLTQELTDVDFVGTRNKKWR